MANETRNVYFFDMDEWALSWKWYYDTILKEGCPKEDVQQIIINIWIL